MTKPTPLEGAVDLAAAALRGGLATVHHMHRAIADKPFAALRVAPGVGDVSEGVRQAHDGITELVYAGLRTAVAIVGGIARVAARQVEVSEKEPAAGSNTALAVAALNGFSGERLVREGNPLAACMTLRHQGQIVPIETSALGATFPRATSRVAVFVHGLACNESLWQRHAERHYGDADTTYGARLQNDLGFTPLYVRYNTGLHISANGRSLAELLEALTAAWPVPLTELILIGHSMGGLVIRSALHADHSPNHEWVRRLRHAFYLGAPHAGAPLEKAVNIAAWLLDRIDITRPLAQVINDRSVGIKDLRFGAVHSDDWRDVDLDGFLTNRTNTPPLRDGIKHHFVSASITEDADHPWGLAIGDYLVRRTSATGGRHLAALPATTHRTERHFGAMGHLDLLNHPAVYDQIRRCLDA